MTIYAKTNAGRLLAFANTQPQHTQLPAQMRDLLRRVDGKTGPQQLLVKPGDQDLLDELINRQWVQAVSTPWRNSAYALADAAGDCAVAAPGAPPFAATQSSGLDDGLDANDAISHLAIEPAKHMMSDFVLTYLPEYANVTVHEIMALKSKAELLCMLSGYIDLVQRAGKPGQQHVQQLLLEVQTHG